MRHEEELADQARLLIELSEPEAPLENFVSTSSSIRRGGEGHPVGSVIY